MFGIDISAGQAGLDLGRARAEGVEFVISKAVAAYRPEHTVADGYQSNIDRTIAAGVPGKGHYLVPNARNTPEASAAFLAENVHRYFGGDVLALDNEPLDSYPVFWRDGEAARFFRRLHAELGHPYSRMWLYCPASLTRANGPFPECAALGVKFWWSAYGSYPTGQSPDHAPSLQGSIPRWDVHQFTSRAWVAGAQVDGNYSPHRITDLFGGVDVGYLQVRPALGNINTPFGPRPKPTPTSPAIHYGQDYGWGGGDEIFAARPGRVKSHGPSGSYGNRLVIDHGGGIETWYCHLSSALVNVGDDVGTGQVAWMGATGNVTAKHLHFELRIDGVAVDPEPYFAGSGTAGGSTTPIEEDDMFTDEDRRKTESIYAALFGPANIKVPMMTWAKPFGEAPGAAYYGTLDLLILNQTRVAELSGKVSGLAAAVAQLGSGGIDITAIEAAAREGAASAPALGTEELQSIAAAVAADVLAGLPGDGPELTAEQVVDAIQQRLAP